MYNKTLGMTFLIAGTTIGAGMLALPCVTAVHGLPYAALIMFICWIFMTASAYLLLETNLDMPNDINVNLITMADRTIGKVGKYITWFTYLMLLYALTAAYITGMSDWIGNGLLFLFDYQLPQSLCAGLFVIVLCSIVLLGVKNLDHINRILMIGLMICFFALVFDLAPNLDPQLWQSIPSDSGLSELPLIITSFGFAIILPSLVSYSRNAKDIKKALFIGSLLPLIMYILWDAMVLGSLPLTGENSFETIKLEGNTLSALTNELTLKLNSNYLFKIIQGFSFFALATSVLGVTLSLYDFLKDGFKSKDTTLQKIKLCIITFGPPLTFALIYPKGFVTALNFAGIFVAILLGILPVWMAFKNRTQRKEDGLPSTKCMVPTQSFGFIVAFFILIIFLEILRMNGITLL